MKTLDEKTAQDEVGTEKELRLAGLRILISISLFQLTSIWSLAQWGLLNLNWELPGSKEEIAVIVFFWDKGALAIPVVIV